MKLKHIFLSAMLATGLLSASVQTTSAQSNTVQEVRKTYFVPKAGTLVELMTEEEANTITHLTLKGKLNAVDFRHLRDEFKHLRFLDLSEASISRYAGKGGTRNGLALYPISVLPDYAFCRQTSDSTYESKHTLHHVILPTKVKAIGERAFHGCDRLMLCEMRQSEAPDLSLHSMADSLTAIFVPQGATDSYRQNKEWGGFAIVEGKPLRVNVEISRMSSLASELQRMGVQPRDVNFLSIEGKTDEADFKLIRDYIPNLVSVNLSNSNATAIPEYTFTQKRFLLRILLPKGLKTIGQRAFSGCSRLGGTMILPETVSAIEFGAFIGCDKLRQVMATGNVITTLGDQLFGDGESKLVYRKK